MRRSREARSEAGAVAVFVAILSTVLLLMAALAVDLGNGWARKRTAQTQVDVSALAAGALLPQTATNREAIVDEVVAYLNRENNDVVGQEIVTRAQMANDDLGDGEVIFSSDGITMRVVAPPAYVDFTFGKLVADGVDVQAEATVELRTQIPPGEAIFPFAMPDQCPFGPAMADTGPGPDDPDPSGTFTPDPARNGTLVSITPSAVATGLTSQNVQVVLDDLPNNSSTADIEFRVGSDTVHKVTVTWPVETSSGDDSRTVNVAVPAAVLENELTWNVWGIVKSKHTTNNLTFKVGSGVPAPDSEVSCQASAEGQFGQMYSPRNNEAPDQRGFALNIALGLDHDLYPWKGATVPGLCGQKTQDPPDGGYQDKVNPEDDPNCILPQTGNDGPWMLQGLITGIEGTPGRLDAEADRDGDGNPDGGTHAQCGSAEVEREGVMINNDRLSCFLLGGRSLSDIAQDTVTTGMLNPDVVNSPRFVWIPVMHAQQRVDVDNNTFMAIKRFVPGFITDETGAATKGLSDASADNGIVINGQLEALQVFMFNHKVLPPTLQSPTVDYDPELGPSVPVLVG